MEPQARREVEGLQAYSAPLEGRRGMLRLDFNENTMGPSQHVVAAIRAIPAEQYAIYPEYEGLRQAVVANLALPLAPSQIGLFNGVDAAIHAIFHAYGGRGDTLLTTSPPSVTTPPAPRCRAWRSRRFPTGCRILASPWRSCGRHCRAVRASC